MENKEKTVTMGAIKSVIEGEVNTGLAPLAAQIKELADKVGENTVAQVASKNTDSGNHLRLMLAGVEAQAKRMNGVALLGGSEASDVEATLEKRYGKTDPAFVKSVKEMHKDLMVTGNGGVLVDQTWMSQFQDQLWDATIMNQMGVKFLPTVTGNLNIPKIVEGLAAGYIGEGQQIDTSTLVFGHISLSTKKMMAIVPLSNDLIRSASLNVEALVNEQLRKTMASTQDHAFLYGKGTKWEPTGIANVEGITKIAGTPDASRAVGLDMIMELGKRNHSTEDAVFIMGWGAYRKIQEEIYEGRNFDQAEALTNARTFLNHKVILTNRVKSDEAKNQEDLFLVKASDVTAIQKYDISIVASNEASIQTKDGIISAFGTDYTFVRATTEHDFGLDYKHSAVHAVVSTKLK